MISERKWIQDAVRLIETDFNRSADTHLFKLDLPTFDDIDIYLKDESNHPTGSLKHRLARSLFLYGICNGWITEGRSVIEASSGSTAVSEAYFARLLGLPFIAVMPKSTSKEKIAAIEFYGGTCHLVEKAGDVYSASQDLANETGGHYIDQFTFAERATDWRGNNNIAESIFGQMAEEEHPIPTWIVTSAGTGGTSATIGRFIRYQRHDTKLMVPDPENSVFYDCYEQGVRDLTSTTGSRIEGIGRPRCEPSFTPEIIDRMMRVPDAGSLAAMRVLAGLLGKRPGGSTGTNFYAVLKLACEMKAADKTGSIVTLLCDPGERYAETYYSDGWLQDAGIDISAYHSAIEETVQTGIWALD